MLNLAAVYVLNLFDVLATYLGVSRGFIQEGNPLMLRIVSDPAQLVWFKGIAVLAALTLMAVLYQKRKARRLIKHGTRLLLGAYFAIFLLHVFWLAKVL